MDYSFDEHCTADEAVKALRKHAKGRKCLIHAGVNLWTDKERTTAFPGSACVTIPLKAAERFVRDALGESFERRGGRIHVAVTDTLIFIG